jgi:hypothetical protein
MVRSEQRVPLRTELQGTEALEYKPPRGYLAERIRLEALRQRADQSMNIIACNYCLTCSLELE